MSRGNIRCRPATWQGHAKAALPGLFMNSHLHGCKAIDGNRLDTRPRFQSNRAGRNSSSCFRDSIETRQCPRLKAKSSGPVQRNLHRVPLLSRGHGRVWVARPDVRKDVGATSATPIPSVRVAHICRPAANFNGPLTESSLLPSGIPAERLVSARSPVFEV